MFDPSVLTRSGTVLLDTARPDDENRASWCFSAPERVLTAHTGEEIPGLLEVLDEATKQGYFVAGYLGYEAGYQFVDLESFQAGSRPLAWFGVYEEPYRLAPTEVETGLHAIEGGCRVQAAEMDVSEAEYMAAIREIRQHIQAGDIYQLNYTSPLRFQFSGDPRALYRRLRTRQRVPYGAFLNLGETHVLSCSPELFVRRDGNHVVTRPMKGTIRRGRTYHEDQLLQEELASDPKNRAENLMIVDLLRNDLSVCCVPGSVSVPSLYTIEAYETVNQMTSTVSGRLHPDAGLGDVLRALFPCGSVTGTPKRRAMRIIRRLEPEPRGMYCGAIGMAGPDDTAVFNVAIRTVVLEGREGRMGVGSGIVWDSEPETEYEECRLKGQFLTDDSSTLGGQTDTDFKLIETMRVEDGEIPLLDRHVQRLAESAAYFSFSFDEPRFRRRVKASVDAVPPNQAHKVRVTLSRSGKLSVTTTSLGTPSDDPWRLTLADERVDRTDPFFYHKTTRRGVYDRALTAAQETGFDEAILLNQDGEVTEGTFTNLFVRHGDALWTPPVESGLLGGVYRGYVLDTYPEASERVLTPEDIVTADRLFCCNAVRGWCRAELVEEVHIG